jgi:heptosyltransferase-2
VLIGGPDDAWDQPSFAHLPVIDRIGTLPLPQTLALLDQADVLVTHDTGPLHLGGVTRVGIVSIFGPTDPRGRLPQRPGTVALWGGEGFACRPCYDAHSFPPCPSNDCMRQITVDRVLGEVHAMLAERAGGVLQPPRILTPESTVGSGRLVSLQAAHPEAR